MTIPNDIQIKVLSTRRYKVGYEVRKEEWVHGNDPPVPMRSAYNLKGEYIGMPQTAVRLIKHRGIMPEKAHPDHCVCSIGFCEREQKWYGWSHRAIFGFGIGDQYFKAENLPEVTIIANLEEAKQAAITFAYSVS